MYEGGGAKGEGGGDGGGGGDGERASSGGDTATDGEDGSEEADGAAEVSLRCKLNPSARPGVLKARLVLVFQLIESTVLSSTIGFKLTHQQCAAP